MVFLKICSICGIFFPIESNTIFDICEGCFEDKFSQVLWLSDIKKSRSFSAEKLMIFDSNRVIMSGYTEKYFNKNPDAKTIPFEFFQKKDGYVKKNLIYEKVCRNCKSPIMNKKGTYISTRVRCNKCIEEDREDFDEYFIPIRSNYLYYRDVVSQKKRGVSFYPYEVYLCEECGGETTEDELDVHHKIPCHTLTMDNIELIWDRSNLILLCSECHKKQDHKLKKNILSDKEAVRFNRLDKWLG